jgi:hypothetical protein
VSQYGRDHLGHQMTGHSITAERLREFLQLHCGPDVGSLLALAAFGTGLMAACKWYEASQVKIDHGYIYPGSQPGETYRSMGVDIRRRPESGTQANR